MVSILKNGLHSNCDIQMIISLISIVSKLLSSVILRGLHHTREGQVHDEQVGFRAGHGCVNQISTLRQPLQHRSTGTLGRRWTLLIDLHYSTFSLRKEVPEKYVGPQRVLPSCVVPG